MKLPAKDHTTIPWLAYAVAAAVVVALLALPGIIMAVAGWLTGGAR